MYMQTQEECNRSVATYATDIHLQAVKGLQNILLVSRKISLLCSRNICCPPQEAKTITLKRKLSGLLS